MQALRIAELEAELAAARAALARALETGPAAPVSPELVAAAAQDLRAPATAVGGYLQMVVDGDAGPIAPEQQHMLECAIFHTRRMTELVDDLVVLTGLPAAGGTRAGVDLGEILRSRAAQLAHLAASRRVRLETLAPACPRVCGDGALLGRAVECLLEQAIMFSPSSASVRCAVRPVAGGVAVEVTDQGMGLDADALVEIMSGRPPRASAGVRSLLAPRLGLALVRAVAEAHGGRAEVSSKDRLTTLRMILPLAP